MLNKKAEKIVKEYEKAGIDVVVLNNDGKIEYATTENEKKEECCDSCAYFALVPDPDPLDWFRDEDKKAVCFELNAVIEGGLEKPSEWTNIKKPIFCPRLGRKLTDEEKKIAEEKLEFARKMFR